jgi:hypothetical protein
VVIIPADNFVLTLPDNATVNSAGEVVADLSLSGIGGADLTLSNLSSAATARTNLGGTATGVAVFTAASAAAARTALEVSPTTAVDLKADVLPLSTRECNLIDTATGSTYSMVALSAGTLTNVAFVLDGVTTAVGTCSVAVDIGGVAVVLVAPLSAPIASVAGFKVSTTVSSGGAYAIGQTIRITTTSANTAATVGTVTLAGIRA